MGRVVVCVFLLALCVPLATKANSASLSATAARGRIAAGAAHTCAIATDDVVWCWGDNSRYQLGSSAHASLVDDMSSTPVQAAALPGGRVARQITSGDSHVCVLANDGSVWCWGENGAGELAQSNLLNQRDPVQVTLSTTATLVVAGGQTTCAVLSTNAVMCWGKNNRGQRGNGAAEANTPVTPTEVVSIPSSFMVESLSIGSAHACATSTTGDAWCWGAYNNSRLGNSGGSDVLTPQSITALTASQSAAAGFNHSCVVQSGTTWCFGANANGQLGSDPGVVMESSTPLSASFSSAVDMVAVGKEYSCALLSNGTVKCFGLNDDGQLGTSTSISTRHTPDVVAGLSGTVVDITLGTAHACAVLSTGAVKCWGAGSYGRLGNGGTTRQASAVSVGSLNIANTTTTSSTSSTSSSSSSSSSSTTSTTTAPVNAVLPQQQAKQPPRYLTLKRNKFITARAIAAHVSLAIPKTSKGTMRLTIVKGSQSCVFVGTRVKGVRKGTCSVLVTLIPKRGARTLRVAKLVVT